MVLGVDEVVNVLVANYLWSCKLYIRIDFLYILPNRVEAPCIARAARVVLILIQNTDYRLPTRHSQ